MLRIASVLFVATAGFPLLTMAGDAKVDRELTNSIGMKLVLLPGGEFMMGSPKSEKGHKDTETAHRVTLTRPFYIGVTEVTQQQYQAIIGNNPAQTKGPDHPVERVSWIDATEFCRQLSEKEGRTYRLPTEAEWEYAARGGSQAPWCFGADEKLSDKYLWTSRNSGGRGSRPVGEKKPNGFGIHDMLGNVCEWCSDWLGDYPATDQVDPKGPDDGVFRVIRGGSWSNSPLYCRSAIRVFSAEPTRRSNWTGFRVVLEP